MYVNILTFIINEKEGLSSNELSMLEDNLTTKPKGMDRFHVFKDNKVENLFYLIEYWRSKDFQVNMEVSKRYPIFNKIHEISKELRFKKIECDIVI
ncbi:MAG: hypothetical protein ABFR32_02265 [Bacteroidota bacterium]